MVTHCSLMLYILIKKLFNRLKWYFKKFWKKKQNCEVYKKIKNYSENVDKNWILWTSLKEHLLVSSF